MWLSNELENGVNIVIGTVNNHRPVFLVKVDARPAATLSGFLSTWQSVAISYRFAQLRTQATVGTTQQHSIGRTIPLFSVHSQAESLVKQRSQHESHCRR
jgi:hypothetical protein